MTVGVIATLKVNEGKGPDLEAIFRDLAPQVLADKAGQVRWLKRLNDKGWIAPDWPTEYGGTGWGLTQKYIFDMEMALAGAPSTSNMGLRMCAPVVMAFGTPEQKAQHLPKILSTDVWWCQG